MNFEKNQMEELVQRCAWRLVRSAEDRIGSGRGQEKLMWAVESLRKKFPKLTDAEDYIRAAFINFKAESISTY
jgi:hypothetical protein